MPRSNGFDLFEPLGGQADTTPIPLIVLTAYDSGENRRWCLDLRARAFFAKPFSLRQVVTRLKERLA